MSSKTPLKIDALSPRFAQLLAEAGTSMEQPAPLPTWHAFKALCREPVECDDEKLFFEYDLSSSQPEFFYVHFARTCYGREPGGHVWSFDVICDFLFPMDDVLEFLNGTIEVEELAEHSPEREAFFAAVEGKHKLWKALETRAPAKAEIYVGES